MYNENHATYEQLMKLVVCDEGQALMTQSNNQLMQDLLHLQSGTTVVGGELLVFQRLKSREIESVKNCLGHIHRGETMMEVESGNQCVLYLCKHVV